MQINCKKLMLLLLIVLLLTSCSDGKPKVDKKYEPVINPHPKYFMTVKGKIDPKLKGKLKLQWIATYYTTNPKCEVWPNGHWNEGGVKSPREKSITYVPKPDLKGHYKLKFILDKFLPGFCNWNLAFVYYKFDYLGYNYGSPGTGIGFHGNRFSGNLNRKTIQAIQLKNKQIISEPSIIYDFWKCNKNCMLSSKYKKNADYIYIANFNFGV